MKHFFVATNFDSNLLAVLLKKYSINQRLGHCPMLNIYGAWKHFSSNKLYFLNMKLDDKMTWSY